MDVADSPTTATNIDSAIKWATKYADLLTEFEFKNSFTDFTV